MPLSRKVTASVIGAVILTGGLLARHPARADSPAPQPVAEELRRVQSDYDAGGIRRLSANWYACVDQARGSQDANTAERCVIYGYGALLLGESNGAASRTPWMRHLTAEMVAPGQIEMLTIMGIPEGPRLAWLDRYRNWVARDYTPDNGAAEAQEAENGASETGNQRGGVVNIAAAYGGTTYSGTPRVDFAGTGGHVRQDTQIDLARTADGKYPREALRQPDIADALRRVVGPSMFARLSDYSFGGPIEFTGRYAVGSACEPRACGVAEVRYVFSAEDAWIAIIDGARMRVYGAPPRQVRALLLRDRNHTVWRGPLDDMNHVAASPVVKVSAEPAAGGPAPRMTISTRPVPVATNPLPQPQRADQRDDGTSEIRLHDHDGSLTVPVMINNTLTVSFAIDSGASDVSVSADVLRKLIDSGTVSRGDFRGKQTYRLADGSAVESETFRIHALRVGDREVRDVLGSVTNDSEGMLLGQSFLKRFRSWSIDNQRQVLLLK